MNEQKFYRGGASLVPRPIDVIIDPGTGLVSTARGVSVSDRPDGLERFGGPHLVGDLPESLRIVKTGRNPHHYEIAPARETTFEEYEEALAMVGLTPI